jgi:hypothetical protein
MCTFALGKYSAQRRVTVSAMSPRHVSYFGYHGFKRASITIGGS